MTEEQMKKRLYAAYQLDWLTTQGYSIEDVISAMDEYSSRHDNYTGDANTLGVFHEWEKKSNGFGGDIWASFDEFCDIELANCEHITSLIEKIGKLDSDTAAELTDIYNRWLEKGRMTEEQMKKRLYELYQLDWMMTHGYSLHDVIKGIDDHETVEHDNYIHDGEVGMYADIEGIFNKWQDYVGFSGYCIYGSFHGFCHDELTDLNYIKGLLDRVPSEEGLRDAYNKWYKENEGE